MAMENDAVKPFNQLFILSDATTSCNLVLLAKSLNIPVKQLSTLEFLEQQQLPEKTLIGVQMKNMAAGKNHFNTLLQSVRKCGSVFLYNAERNTLDSALAIRTGIRGIIYRDEQLDRVLSALNNMMKGQLYYSRNELSNFVDQSLTPEENDELHLNSEKFLVLTRQERRITKLIANGARNKEIADQLNISTHTVKAHVSTILRKTQSRNRVELIRIAQTEPVSSGSA